MPARQNTGQRFWATFILHISQGSYHHHQILSHECCLYICRIDDNMKMSDQGFIVSVAALSTWFADTPRRGFCKSQMSQYSAHTCFSNIQSEWQPFQSYASDYHNCVFQSLKIDICPHWLWPAPARQIASICMSTFRAFSFYQSTKQFCIKQINTTALAFVYCVGVTHLRDLSPRKNYTGRATAYSRRS
jgi:hypothetical protein